MELGAWSLELEQGAGVLLEVDLGLEGQLEWQPELDPRKSREIQADPPKSRLLVQNGLPHLKRASNPHSGGIPGAVFKNGKCKLCPRHVLYNSRSSLDDLYEKCIFKEPYGRNPERNPPFSSISFLLTARAGILTPHRS